MAVRDTSARTHVERPQGTYAAQRTSRNKSTLFAFLRKVSDYVPSEKPRPISFALGYRCHTHISACSASSVLPH